MNYSKVLKNPQYMAPPRSSSASKKLESLYQLKNNPLAEVSIKKPFSNLAENKEPIPNEGIGHPPPGFKPTNYALTTTKRNEINQIVEKFIEIFCENNINFVFLGFSWKILTLYPDIIALLSLCLRS